MLFWSHLHTWFGIGMTYEKIQGVKFVAPKTDFYFLRAHISFLARAKILRQPLVTLKTFVFYRFFIMFLICSKNALVKMGFTPPPSCSCRHFWVGTLCCQYKINGTNKNKTFTHQRIKPHNNQKMLDQHLSGKNNKNFLS